MLSFIVQRSFVTINSQCRAFMAVKKLKVSVNHHFVTENTLHILFCEASVHTNVFWSSQTQTHLTIANLWMVWNVWSTFMALFAGCRPRPRPHLVLSQSGLWWRWRGLRGPRGKFDLKILTEGHTQPPGTGLWYLDKTKMFIEVRFWVCVLWFVAPN